MTVTISRCLGLQDVRIKVVKIVVGGLWGVLLAAAGSSASFGSQVAFAPIRMSCLPVWASSKAKMNKTLLQLILSLLMCTPLLLILLSNICILWVAWTKTTRAGVPRSNQKAVIMVICITATYIVSLIPEMVGLGMWITWEAGTIPLWMPVLSEEFSLLNSVVNPFIYKLMNLFKARVTPALYVPSRSKDRKLIADSRKSDLTTHNQSSNHSSNSMSMTLGKAVNMRTIKSTSTTGSTSVTRRTSCCNRPLRLVARIRRISL